MSRNDKYRDDEKFFRDSLLMQERLRAEQGDRMMKEIIEARKRNAEEADKRKAIDDKYGQIVSDLLKDLPKDKRIELVRAVTDMNTEKLEALIKKYTSKEPIKLSKIPKVPKVPSKKLLKEIPEYNHKIPTKIVKSNRDVINEINKIVAEVEALERMTKPKSTKPKAAPKPKHSSNAKAPKLTEEEKLARREARKEATRLRNIEKKANEKRIKAEAKQKLEAHKKEVEAEKHRIEQAKLRKSREVDELKSDFTMFRRYVRYLPTPSEIPHLSGKPLQSAKDYLADAEQYYRNAVDTYKKYKKEGLLSKEDLDKLVELFEVKHNLDIMNNVKELLH